MKQYLEAAILPNVSYKNLFNDLILFRKEPEKKMLEFYKDLLKLLSDYNVHFEDAYGETLNNEPDTETTHGIGGAQMLSDGRIFIEINSDKLYHVYQTKHFWPEVANLLIRRIQHEAVHQKQYEKIPWDIWDDVTRDFSHIKSETDWNKAYLADKQELQARITDIFNDLRDTYQTKEILSNLSNFKWLKLNSLHFSEIVDVLGRNHPKIKLLLKMLYDYVVKKIKKN